MSDVDREVLFANERLLIGMLQAVSGASVVAAISQWDALVKHAGPIGVLVFLTAMAVALMLAVAAAYWKHEYKKWDVKAGVSEAEAMVAKLTERDYGLAQVHTVAAQRRRGTTLIYLALMRAAMLGATILILTAIGALVTALWLTQVGVLRASESVLN